MSRLYVTSSKTRARRANAVCSRLKVSGNHEAEECFARSHRKPSTKRESFLRSGEDGFLAIAGTAIFDGGLGTEKKEEIYELFARGGVKNVRSKVLGHYAIAVKQEDKITLFTDPLGSFALYYTSDNDSWLASNSLHACAASCDHVSLDETRLVATILQSGLPADRTFYHGIRRLLGPQVIRADATDGAFRVERHEPPTYDFANPPSSVSEAVDQYMEKVRSVFDRITEVGEIGVMLSGGLDSRTVLAGVLDQGKAPTVLSGTGDNSRKSDDRDREIARKIAREFGLDFRKIDWSDRQPHSRNRLKESFEKYGFQHEVYGSPEGLTGFLEESQKLILGGYSPVFTRKPPRKSGKNKFDKESVLKEYIEKEYQKDAKNEKEYLEKVKKDVSLSIENRSVKQNGKVESLEDFSAAVLDLKINRDARFANFVNGLASYVDPFRTKVLYEPLKRVNRTFREGRRIQSRAIAEMESSLAGIEVCSGWEKKRIHRGRLEDEKFEITLWDRLSKKYIERKASGVVNKYVPTAVTEAAETLRKASSTVWPQIHKDHAMKREYSRRLSGWEVVQQHVSDVSTLPLKALARLEYFAVGIKSVADTIENRPSPDGQ